MGPAPTPAVDRVLARCDVADCWVFTGSGSDKYGRVDHRLTHRVVWEALVGPIPEGYNVDHMCCVKRCVNPDHLRIVTPAENHAANRNSAAAQSRRKTHCTKGHPYSGDNLWVSNRGWRQCKQCNRDNKRRRYAAKRKE